MIINQLLKVVGGWVGEHPANLVETQHADTYVYAGTEPLTQGTTIGLWNGETGDPIDLNLDEYKAIRPLGNGPDGTAPVGLDYHSFMGHAVRNLEPGRKYPAAESPFVIEVRHKLFTGNANPAWDGWGWRAEIVGPAGSRDPSARAIGIYSDAACTAYLYTTGAFIQQASAWQVDANGSALTVWATEYNPGLLGYDNDAKHDVHHACLLGSAQEGHATLAASAQSAAHEFWKHPQGYVAPPTAGWVDTGATITALAGQVYRTSSVLTGLTVNQPLRLGPTLETKFNGYWPVVNTPSDYIQITPYVGVSVGTKVYKWA